MKHVVITGGTGGLGKAIAAAFTRPGWQIDAPGSGELDVRDRNAIAAYFRNRAPELLICSAGATNDQPLVRLGDEAWDQTLSVNFQGAADCAAVVVPRMISRGSGHIIFISSHSALHPPIGQAAYATAKAALLGLTADLARIHGPRNIRVNAILPGFLQTRMTEAVTGKRREEVQADHHLGRFNTPEAVAGFIHHLHLHLPHTSGQVFQLDSRTSP